MAEIIPSPSLLATLNGKVAVLTGGANGIGAATVRLLTSLGAKVIFCDLDATHGEALASELGPEKAIFVKADVTDYGEQYALFRTALAAWGKVDVVIANAGIIEQGNIFGLTEDLSQPPSMAVLDVNLKAVIYTARLGVGFMRQTGGGTLVLLSSMGGFRGNPGVWVYVASKHGVYGLMRCLRSVAAPQWGISVNVICPSMTKTGMVDAIEDIWNKAALPANDASDVAMGIATAATANNGDGRPGAAKPFNGKALFISGSRFYEIEDNIDRLEPEWLGEQNSQDLFKLKEALGSGEIWDSKQ
ncbi:3-hydroxyacyl-CoA dehydrogenase [Dacryopinax primogenitus]|uniref:3-hydroxyacyl-CoA dehydrogenase n=1 Tax=Dacryopinax primogenitus (strain DJM 731) TaxID=1858805 RepID=M5FS17_DACPD|nr:3-hydroxyacyl-CoA dehydrogenase [Dacryopinax primogenitus]EJU00086.1 3-hydroxyacyl-CoA dehydrogenase [Dacryopinax primogenitus]